MDWQNIGTSLSVMLARLIPKRRIELIVSESVAFVVLLASYRVVHWAIAQSIGDPTVAEVVKEIHGVFVVINWLIFSVRMAVRLWSDREGFHALLLVA